MLYFGPEEVQPQKAGKREKCFICADRVGTWFAPMGPEGNRRFLVCAYCLLYRFESTWGQANRDELLHLGRFCQKVAGENGKKGPELDERGRLSPSDAEKFVLGVSVTSRLLSHRVGSAEVESTWKKR